MAKAMGCNTIAAYIFWNFHETGEGIYDFTTGNHNIGEFFKIVQEEGMWLIIRPGPYVCAEWDLGGIPPYLCVFLILSCEVLIQDIWQLQRNICQNWRKRLSHIL